MEGLEEEEVEVGLVTEEAKTSTFWEPVSLIFNEEADTFLWVSLILASTTNPQSFLNLGSVSLNSEY